MVDREGEVFRSLWVLYELQNIMVNSEGTASTAAKLVKWLLWDLKQTVLSKETDRKLLMAEIESKLGGGSLDNLVTKLKLASIAAAQKLYDEAVEHVEAAQSLAESNGGPACAEVADCKHLLALYKWFTLL
eukprot:gene27268-2522_t